MSRRNRRRDDTAGKRKRLNRKGAGRRVPPRSKARCGKIGYRDEAEAKAWLTLFAARHQQNGQRVEKRAYRCHECMMWHLTAQDIRS